MHVILVRPYDDEDIVDVLIVQHKDNKSVKDFVNDFEEELEKAKADEPDTRDVTEVYANIENKGWRIIVHPTETVTY